MLRAAVALGLVVALTACGESVRDLSSDAPKIATPTHTPTTRLTKPPAPNTSVTTTTTSGLGEPQVVPDPASHKACRILDWNDLPPDVRPAPGDLSTHVTFANDPEFCRIDNSEFVIADPGSPEAHGDPDIRFFKVMSIVSDRLTPIEKYVGPDEHGTGRMITIGGHEAVEIVRNGEPPGCDVIVAPATGPFGIMITNNRFPQYDPCEIAWSLTEAILRRLG